MKIINTKKNTAFTLLYTVVITSIIAIITGIMAGSILKELNISRDEAESLKAFYAADSGAECASFYQKNYQAFNTDSPSQPYDCGLGQSFTAGGGLPAGSDCESATYSFDLKGFQNGSCAKVSIVVEPIDVYLLGIKYVLCNVGIVSEGKNDCSASGSKLVERTRWENL